MTGPGAEMPFLEHLEELRARLVRVVLALIAGFGVGLFVVQHFGVVTLLKEPIAPFLTVTGGKLVVTSPTEAVMITLKLALIVGLFLSSPSSSTRPGHSCLPRSTSGRSGPSCRRWGRGWCCS